MRHGFDEKRRLGPVRVAIAVGAACCSRAIFKNDDPVPVTPLKAGLFLLFIFVHPAINRFYLQNVEAL